MVTNAVLRVVFDTNAFTPNHFDLISNGPLARLCMGGRIVPIYGHVFLEEMWRAYGSESRRTYLVEQWMPFIIKTVHRFCDDFVAIFHRELVEGRGRHANIYLAPKNQQQLLRQLSNVPLDGSWAAWHRTKHQREIESTKRDNQREISKAIRQEVADTLKAAGYSKKHHGGPPTFNEFLRRESDRVGEAFIFSLVNCSSPTALAHRWSRDKAAYPYFTMFVTNMAYMGYYAATRPNEKIDLNAQADLDVMTHLLRADVLVSNETGFLKSAFDDLWRPQGKVLLTSTEFAALVEKFA